MFSTKYALGALAAGISILCAASAFAADPIEAALDVLRANPDSMSAVRLFRGNGAPFCTIGKETDKVIFVDNDRTAVLYSPEFRQWHGKGDVTKYTEVRSNVKELFSAMVASRCQYVVESAANIIALVQLLEREEMRFSILTQPLNSSQLAEAFAASLGFSSHAELLLAAHMMANSDELKAYFRLGIRTPAAYDEALARMQSQGYSEDQLQLLSYLADEAEGTRRNLPPAVVREERLARAPASGK